VSKESQERYHPDKQCQFLTNPLLNNPGVNPGERLTVGLAHQPHNRIFSQSDLRPNETVLVAKVMNEAPAAQPRGFTLGL